MPPAYFPHGLPEGSLPEKGLPLFLHPEVRPGLSQALDDWVLERQMELTAIPAPPFGEGRG